MDSTAQQNHQQGYVMAQNGWSAQDIISFCKRLNIPAPAARQFIQGYKKQRKLPPTGSIPH